VVTGKPIGYSEPIRIGVLTLSVSHFSGAARAARCLGQCIPNISPDSLRCSATKVSAIGLTLADTWGESNCGMVQLVHEDVAMTPIMAHHTIPSACQNHEQTVTPQ